MQGLKPYPAYKESGLPWLGKVPEHWEAERAKWLFRKMDRPAREEDEVITCFRDGMVTLRKNRRVRGFTEALKEIGYQGIRRGDLVIHAMDAFAGAVGVADSDGKGTPVYSVCQPLPRANAHYFAFTIREMARAQWIQALAKGIRERSTDFRYDDFGSQPVPLPPLSEQTAIVRFLDYMDSRIRRYIRAKQKLIKLLEEQKQAIIHQAVTGQIDVRTGKPYPAYKPSGVEWLGNVPKHWEVRRVRSCLLSTRSGIWGTDPDPQNASDQIICIRVADFDIERLRVSTKKLTVRAIPESARMPRLLQFGDILLEKSGGGEAEPIGRVVLFDIGLSAVSSNFIVSLRPDRTVVTSEFLLHVLAIMQVTRRNVPCIKQTTGIQNLYERAYLSLPIAIPPIDQQNGLLSEITSMLKPIMDGINYARKHIDLLREYRTRLIADVVTGKLDVRMAVAKLPDKPEETEPVEDAEQGDDNEAAMDAEGDPGEVNV